MSMLLIKEKIIECFNVLSERNSLLHCIYIASYFSSTDNGLKTENKQIKESKPSKVPNPIKNNSIASSTRNIQRESAIVFSSPTPR